MSVFVITGASTGVGRACALRFAAEGNIVAALARSAERLNALHGEAPGSVFAYPTDVSRSDQVRSAFQKILEEHGRVDVLINNAGVTGPAGGPLDYAVVDQLVDTNLKGTMYCTAAVLPAMTRQGGGTIVNVASIAGVDIAQLGNIGIYAATKYGVVAFGDSLGRTVRKDGILITTICPGGIDTPLWNQDNPYPYDKEAMIRPEEVADLIAYVLRQPRRTLFKNIIFIPTVEQW